MKTYACPYRQGNLTREEINHNKAMREVQLNDFFGEVKTYNFLNFTTTEDRSELCWKDLFSMWGFRMPRLVYMATN